jgi:thiamine biosynthesis lipoprotein
MITERNELILMGTAFELIAVGNSQEKAQKSIQAGIEEIQRIERLISSWEANSQTSNINRNAGIRAVKVDEELFNLIKRSLKISQLTRGAFDISFASLDHPFIFDGQSHPLPDQATLATSIQKIDFNKIILDEANQTVFLKEKGMKIGFGGIGKGYAANKAIAIMREYDLLGIVVNASGDIRAWGKNEQNMNWKVAITDPNDPWKSIGNLTLGNLAVVTSGDYEKYFTHEGKRYAHIINPKTGMPTSGIQSVTIVCPDAEIADALATSVFVLGKNEGLELINHLKGVEGLIVTDHNEILTSKNLKLQVENELAPFQVGG